MPRRHRVLRRFRALLRAEPTDVRAGFVAHLLATATGLLAGLILGSITGTLGELPGLLVLVPAAVGLRGNVFGALGSRLGTLVATGNFQLSRRRDTEVGQNLAASVALSLGLSLLLAVVAKGVAESFGVRSSIGVADLIVVSVIGAIIPTVVVMAITVGVAATGVRHEWDVDNVSVPLVTAAGDLVTLPSLFLATFLVRDIARWVPAVIAALCIVGATAGLVAALRTHLPVLRRIAAESVPFLLVAGVVSTLAGITIQSRLDTFDRYPALLMIIPPLLSLSGSLAGILSARVATKLHLGIVTPSRASLRRVSGDITLVFAIALPIFLVLGLAADALAAIAGLSSPGVLEMIGLVVLAGVVATALSCVVAYVAALATYRLGWDPDNNGVPLVSSASDFLGAASLMVCLGILGLS
ncbi:MAG TPA: magnesium transporter [Acidimicrobiia bacterium]|nr:magnesium transporter [Acidimicrobiia bacterium]